MPRRYVYVPDLLEEGGQRSMTATINASSGSCFVRVRPNISSDGMILCGRAMMCRSASRLCPGWGHLEVIGAA